MMSIITIDITGNCNLACDFCYQLAKGELSKEDVLSIVKEQDANVVNVGGGEPFLHNDITGMIHGIVDAGKKVHISTNGTIIPDEVLGLEEKVRRNIRIQVSINSSTPKTYELITGKDLFEKVMKNIGLLKEKYDVALSTVIYRKNIDEVPGIIQLSEKMSLPVRFGLVLPVGKGKNVELITKEEANWVRGYLLVKEIEKRGMIYGPLVHNVSCPLLRAYGFESKGKNACCAHGKTYYNPRGEKGTCEFMIN